VFAHGIGTNMGVFERLSEGLEAAGFTTLRYDYPAHGWSIAKEPFAVWDKDALLEQLKGLLAHVLEKDEPVSIMVGHSTGGLLAVRAFEELERNIESLTLVSPAFYANKPVIAQLADQLPGSFHYLTRKGALAGAVRDAYIGNAKDAYATHRGGEKEGKHIYPEVYQHAVDQLRRSLNSEIGNDLIGGITGINSYMIRGDLLRGHLDCLKRIMVPSRKSQPPPVLLLWGTHDVVVNYEDHGMVTAAVSPEHITLVPLEKLGHESLYEDSKPIIEAMLHPETAMRVPVDKLREVGKQRKGTTFWSQLLEQLLGLFCLILPNSARLARRQ